MRVRAVVLLSWGLVVARPVFAQTAKSALDNFRDSVLRQQLFLKGYSADATVKYDWTGDGVTMRGAEGHTLAVVRPDSVKVNNDRIEIKASRTTLVRETSGKYGLIGGTPVEIDVALNGSDANTVLPKLKEAIFVGSAQVELAGIPAAYKSELPGPIASTGLSETNELKAHPCPAGLSQPKVIRSVPPEYTREAGVAKVSGAVRVTLTVDESGRVVDPWISVALGYGLDEQAIHAVRQYRFKPATCGGAPVEVVLNVEVAFQVF